MQTHHPLVSIIIPVYNQAQYLPQSINSALSQTYTHCEIIVVDDGSTDETAAIASCYRDKIRYIYQENHGLAGARNTGIRAADGQLIGLLDSDDSLQPDYLETMVSLAHKYPEATVFYCSAQCMDASGYLLPQIVGLNTTKHDNLYISLLQSNFLIPSTIIMRRSTVIEANYFDQELRSCEDWDLWLRILPDTKFIGTEELLVHYRVHEQSLSANVSGMQTAKQAVIEKLFGLDDGAYARWEPEKRTAFSGLYRYFLITSIQRGGNWQAGIENLYKSLRADPSRASDLDLFYELALGVQPVGYRGSTKNIELESNAKEVINLIENVYQLDDAGKIQHLKRQVYGTAYYAIGLVAYNIGLLKFCRHYLWKAGMYRPSLWISSNLPGNLFKSILGNAALDNLRRGKKSSL